MESAEFTFEAQERNLRRFPDMIALFMGAAGILVALNHILGLRIMGIVLVENVFLYLEMVLFLSITFLLYPARKTASGAVPWYDWLLFVCCAATCGYLALNGENIVNLGWVYRSPVAATVASGLLCLLALEAVRRVGGTVILVVCAIFGAYPIIAHLMPGFLWAPRLDVGTVLREHALGAESILGQPIRVVMTVLMGFLIFGASLIVTGGGRFFMDIAMALLGRTRGGTAKVAIMSSALFGSLSGSVLSNIVTTGRLTIPAMRKAGYPATYAAAVEACASTGGTLMPPVMGAVAFIMADFLRVSYVEVAIAALVPSILFYLALVLQVDMFAARKKLTVPAMEDLPSVWEVLGRGWHHLGGLVLLTYLLIGMRLETYAPYYATVFVVGVSLLRRQIGLLDLLKLVRESIRTIVNIFAILAGIGMVIGALTFTGVGAAFSRELILFGGNNTLLLLGFGAITSFILGMGMTITACYLLLATILPSALVQQGLDPMAVHLFILYWGMLSFITPPVALGAMAAGSVAGTKTMPVGFKSMRIGAILFVLPFMFALNPELILHGEFIDCVAAVVTACISIVLISQAMEGWAYRVGPIGMVPRALFLLAGGMLLSPGVFTDSVGGAAAVAGFAAAWFGRARAETQKPAAEA
ncbi:TRAP transporter permease [Oricola indica]|uniref:TRAP transporter permease n=1 Tax=Oricola indica TaxID=2872591 RepID=UPI001CC028FC|nr:TRAP transporter fused permease subunit [Oricola indica]